jgi:hypothetical protein
MPRLRRILPPDPWGITPRAQRIQAKRSKAEFWGDKCPFPRAADNRLLTPMRTRKESALTGIFTKAEQNKSPADKVAELGAERVQARRAAQEPAATDKPAAEAKPALPKQRPGVVAGKEFDINQLPTLTLPWMRIQESVFTIGDPEAEYDDLERDLKLNEALTPGNLEQALNRAEDNARRAHKLYVVGKVQFEAYERELTPIIEAMRQAANDDLQNEKASGSRNKAITDADVRGRAAVLFPDEWALASDRKAKAEGTMSQVKALADLWRQRCYSISALLSAGKR